MVEIFAYAFGIMYSPGPVNVLSLNAGLQGRSRATLFFCFGVACAMLLLFLLLAYTGAWLLGADHQLLISAAGCCYIAYLGLKIAYSGLRPMADSATAESPAEVDLNFKTGLGLQLLNPKSFVAILPIVGVQFPAANISGGAIVLWSLLLSILAFGAPTSYWLLGAKLGRLIQQPRYFSGLNILMAALLLYVAADIAYSHVYRQWLALS